MEQALLLFIRSDSRVVGRAKPLPQAGADDKMTMSGGGALEVEAAG